MAHLLSARHFAIALRLAALLAVPVIFGAAASPAWSFDVVYAESNSTAGNSILSFRNDGSGALRFLSSTPAGGIGVFDPSFALGPFDSDQEIILSADKSRLFAVNGGSDSVSVFNVAAELLPREGGEQCEKENYRDEEIGEQVEATFLDRHGHVQHAAGTVRRNDSGELIVESWAEGVRRQTFVTRDANVNVLSRKPSR